MNDYVICLNCMTEQIVPKGSDTCQECGKEGTLVWADIEKKEVAKKPHVIGKLENPHHK